MFSLKKLDPANSISTDTSVSKVTEQFGGSYKDTLIILVSSNRVNFKVKYIIVFSSLLATGLSSCSKNQWPLVSVLTLSHTDN